MNRRAILIIDLGFGDGGKGTIVDYLTRRDQADLVIRFNGGPQAGHNVVLPNGAHHTFSQFGSGSFVPSVRTLLSRFMLIDPYAMHNEAAHLDSIGVSDVLSRTIIDERCLVITPVHQISNRIRERARGADAHGTCGMGVGECVADSIDSAELSLHAGDLLDRARSRGKLFALFEKHRAALAPLRLHGRADELRVLDDPSWIDTALDVYSEIGGRATISPASDVNRILGAAASPIFEGAQGVLLDERYGFHPHTTWSRTTFSNADELLDESGYAADRQRIGVMRTYMTRHGAGPFATQSRELDENLAEPHNNDRGWQRNFRRGVLDLVMLRHSLAACGGVDGIAITHLDRLPLLPRHVCDAYDFGGEKSGSIRFDPNTSLGEMKELGKRLMTAKPIFRQCAMESEDAFVADIQAALSSPVKYRSRGPSNLDKN